MVCAIHVKWKTFDQLVHQQLLIHFLHSSFEIAQELLSLLQCRVDHLVTSEWPETKLDWVFHTKGLS